MNRRALLISGLFFLLAAAAAVGIIVFLISAIQPVTTPVVLIVTATPAGGWWSSDIFAPLPTFTPHPQHTLTHLPSPVPPLVAPPTLATRLAQLPTQVIRTLTLTPTPTDLPPSPIPATAVAAAPEEKAPQPPRTGFRLAIPSLGLDLPVTRAAFIGTTWNFEPITTQAAHLDGLALPGSANNVVIGAHSELTQRRPGPFYRLNRLRPGDEIIVRYGGQEFRYQVQRLWIVVPTDISPIQQGIGDVLTLLTCDGYNQTTNGYDTRLIVRAFRVS